MTCPGCQRALVWVHDWTIGQHLTFDEGHCACRPVARCIQCDLATVRRLVLTSPRTLQQLRGDGAAHAGDESEAFD